MVSILFACVLAHFFGLLLLLKYLNFCPLNPNLECQRSGFFYTLLSASEQFIILCQLFTIFCGHIYSSCLFQPVEKCKSFTYLIDTLLWSLVSKSYSWYPAIIYNRCGKYLDTRLWAPYMDLGIYADTVVLLGCFFEWSYFIWYRHIFSNHKINIFAWNVCFRFHIQRNNQWLLLSGLLHFVFYQVNCDIRTTLLVHFWAEYVVLMSCFDGML
jgi:hypothetical protein